MITTPSSAIDSLGGPRAVASTTKRKYTTVSSWRARESIPIRAWPELIAMAAGAGVEGITYQTLAEVHTKAKNNKSASTKQAA